MTVLIWIMLMIYGIWCLVAFTYALYVTFGLFKRFFHDFVGFHLPDDRKVWLKGDRRHCRCKVCDRILILTDDGGWVVE